MAVSDTVWCIYQSYRICRDWWYRTVNDISHYELYSPCFMKKWRVKRSGYKISTQQNVRPVRLWWFFLSSTDEPNECGLQAYRSHGETEWDTEPSSVAEWYRSAPDYAATSNTSVLRKMAGMRSLIHCRYVRQLLMSIDRHFSNRTSTK
jgi:hypothetical protein